MIYFISDLHLGLFERSIDKKREDVFLNFLKSIENNCDTLVIVGDFFDYWFEWDLVIPKYFYRTLTALHDFVKSGKKVEYVMGNHDFGHKSFFKDELGIDIHPNAIERTYGDKRFYIYHGDGLSYNDNLYKIVKKILRNKTALKLYSTLIHPDRAIKLASSTSKTSRKHTDSKKYSDKDGMQDFAFRKIDEGFDYVIFGHRHKLSYTPHNNGFYINLGDWIKKPHYGIFDGKDFKLLEAPQPF
jgi:UDP-2,3-diacylglucosamine hydrolase